jgi:hypothetical protein
MAPLRASMLAVKLDADKLTRSRGCSEVFESRSIVEKARSARDVASPGAAVVAVEDGVRVISTPVKVRSHDVDAAGIESARRVAIK